MSGVTFATATRAEIGLMLDWAADEGWNPGLGDADAFAAADPAGFFVARAGGKAVAAISVVNHDDTMAFLGLYLCHPDFRGQGIGFGLWQHALAHAGGRCVGLDGVAAQQANYARSGFALHGATTRLEGPAPTVQAGDIRPLDPTTDLDAIMALDRAANGYDRRGFLPGWVGDAQPQRKSVVIERHGQIAGFGTARLCRLGAKIGPLVAPDPAAAVTLLGAAAQALGAASLSVDLPDTQGRFRAMLTKRGFVATFETARMYRGTPPASSPLLRAIATMELG